MVVEFAWDNVVIGSTLSALKFSLDNQYPILFNREPDLFSFRKLSNNKPESEVWEKIASRLSIGGLNPFGNKISSIRINSDTIDIFCKNKRYAVYYKKVYSIYKIIF